MFMKKYILIGSFILFVALFFLTKNNQNCICKNCDCLNASKNICSCEK